MKKVRYLAGTIGAAAPILGMMMAAPAASAAPVHSARPGAKTVSLGHAAVTMAGISAATSSSSPNVSPDAGCTGHIKVHEVFQGDGPFTPSLSTSFWYKNAIHDSAVCVGTVSDTWRNIIESTVQRLRVRIWSGTGPNKFKAFNRTVGARTVNSHTLKAAVGPHQWFGTAHGLPVQVCTAWVSSQGRATAGPQCKSLG